MTARILGITTALLVLSTLAVALRLYTRFGIVRTPGWDDALIVAAVALWLSIPFYNLTLTLAKISMILLYMRLFASTNKRFRILLIVFLVFMGIVGLWTLFSTFLICLPVRGFWDHSVPATCRSFAVVWCLNAALQIVTDIVVVMTPIPTLARLRLPTRQKFALILSATAQQQPGPPSNPTSPSSAPAYRQSNPSSPTCARACSLRARARARATVNANANAKKTYPLSTRSVSITRSL
ncbi:integral membrane protein [Aspergillus fumigatus Af293]|uniref:Integral membrane protein n=1 Tax=Aspergillus fumigatus (strain ATCC MYA-4609 / CBS 101355 / FGSC A1100 / Af293) TaxID=330879 RepID=Q4WX93_ASPFU|nr:integral membrane protein [Aspergillus fumigatus Af293]EAL92710.1 integral membrane protein [Aspergillus fumigatus Af293]